MRICERLPYVLQYHVSFNYSQPSHTYHTPLTPCFPIHHQWVSEAKRHLKHRPSILAYHGDARKGGEGRRLSSLSGVEIVVITFDTLSSDIDLLEQVQWYVTRTV